MNLTQNINRNQLIHINGKRPQYTSRRPIPNGYHITQSQRHLNAKLRNQMQKTAPNQIQRILQQERISNRAHKRAGIRNASCLQLSQHQNHILIRLRRVQVQNLCTVPRRQKSTDTIPPTPTENQSQIQTH